MNSITPIVSANIPIETVEPDLGASIADLDAEELI